MARQPLYSFRLKCWLLACGAAAGCNYGPTPPIQYETEHLRIGTDFDEPLCEGDLVALERMISKIEDELTVTLDGPVTIYAWTEEGWWAGPHNHCRDQAYACVELDSNTIYTRWENLGHELVHAVMGRTQLGAFFEESLADVYGGDQTRFGRTAPTDNVGTSWLTADRNTGPHFIRWLRERWGAQKFGELIALRGSAFKNFERVYGVSLENTEQLYFADAPFGYPSLYGCDGPELQPAEADGGWLATFDLDCSLDADTRTAGEGMIVHRTFVVTEPGLYSVSVDADWLDIYRCSPARIEEGVAFEDFINDDVWPHHASYPGGISRQYEGRVVHDLFLEAGRHDIGVGLLGHGSGSATLVITPALGPQPATPD